MEDGFIMPFWGAKSSEELEEHLTNQAEPILNVEMIQNYVLKSDTTVRKKGIELKDIDKKKYIPGKSFYDYGITSTLTQMQHETCLSVLKSYKTGRSESSFSSKEQTQLALYMKLLDKIKVENVKYLESAKASWTRCKNSRLNSIKPWVKEYVDKLWKINLQRSLLYPQFYKSVKEAIQLSYENTEPSVSVQHLKDVLHLGKVAKFVKPVVFVKRVLRAESAPIPNELFTYNSKLPVSFDNNINPILENHDFDVVISSSALKRLMDDTDYGIAWDIPIVIKCYTITKGTEQKVRKVVYIDKPLPNKSPTVMDFHQQCYKRLIKTNYCMFSGITFPTVELLREFPKTASFKMCDKNNIEEEPDENKDMLSYSENQDDVIINNKILHNVSYRIWNISISDEQNELMKTKVLGKNIKFLVRTKTDACETNKKSNNAGSSKSTNGVTPLVIVPKLEYQIEYGANVSTKTELIRQWTALFFRPNSDMYRVRLTSHNSELISTEHVNCQQINYEAHNQYNYKPVLRLGVLYKVFSNLLELEAGSYLLSHNNKQGPFVDILKSSPSIQGNKDQFFDLHLTYSREKCKLLKQVTNVPWCPIDVHYILPTHEAYKRMPGLYGKFSKVAVKKKAKSKKKNAKKLRGTTEGIKMFRIDFDKPPSEDECDVD